MKAFVTPLLKDKRKRSAVTSGRVGKAGQTVPDSKTPPAASGTGLTQPAPEAEPEIMPDFDEDLAKLPLPGDKVPPADVEASGTPPPKTGMIRMYHAENDTSQKSGAMWSANLKEVQDKAGDDGKVAYVDLPMNSEHLVASGDWISSQRDLISRGPMTLPKEVVDTRKTYHRPQPKQKTKIEMAAVVPESEYVKDPVIAEAFATADEVPAKVQSIRNMASPSAPFVNQSPDTASAPPMEELTAAVKDLTEEMKRSRDRKTQAPESGRSFGSAQSGQSRAPFGESMPIFGSRQDSVPPNSPSAQQSAQQGNNSIFTAANAVSAAKRLASLARFMGS